MDIVCIGQSVYDITFAMNEEMVENQKYRIVEKTECAGGPATNAAVLCAMWGAQTTLLARVGKDVYGDQILADLQRFHVSCTSMYKDPAFETSISAIIVNKSNGHRTILNVPGEVVDHQFVWPKQQPAVVLMDGHEGAASKQALQRYPNAVSILDAGTLTKQTMELGAHVDDLICSQRFAYQLTGINITGDHESQWREVMKQLHAFNPRNIAVTLGENGVVYMENNNIHHLAAYPAHVVDTCGAGDIFHGAFAYCMAKKIPFVQALKISSMSASISVERNGSQTSIPSRELVNKRLLQAKETVQI